MKKRCAAAATLATALLFSADWSLDTVFEEDNVRFEHAAPILRGVVFAASDKDLILRTQGVSGILFRGLQTPGDLADLEERLTPFLGKARITPKTLAAVKKEVIFYYRDLNRPFVTVISPEQDITDGVLQLIVIESRVGRIEFSGNKHFSSEQLEGLVHLRPGDPIDSPQLHSDVAWINRNPFRHVDIITTPGEEHGTTDIRLITKDRRTLRLFTGIDNTGNDFTGNARLMAGFNWANAFLADQMFTYQYTSDDWFQRFQSHTVNYMIPLPWRHTMTFYGGYSTVKPNIDHFESHGMSGQASFRYQLPLGRTYISFLQDLNIGFDFKATNSDLFFEDTVESIRSPMVNLTQAVLAYHFGWEVGSHQIGFDLEAFISPLSWLPNQSKHDFRELRADANPKYAYGRIGIEDRFYFLNCELWTQARAQGSTANLLPSEQFGLGGYNTVRGYAERIVNTDNALCVNLELKTPSFSILGWTRKKSTDRMLFLGFVDFGLGRNHELLEGEKSPEYLLGVGPGVRYNMGTTLQARLDWGFPLLKIEGHNLHQRLHFAVALSY